MTQRRKWLAWVLFVLAGCSDGVTHYPVTGKLLLNGKPFSADTVTVLFKPVSPQGDATAAEPIGTVDAGGTYTVASNGRPGAAPGRYKVVVTARDSTPVAPQVKRKGKAERPLPKSLLPAKYGTAQTTDLVIEVVEKPAPGAYDLKLSQ